MSMTADSVLLSRKWGSGLGEQRGGSRVRKQCCSSRIKNHPRGRHSERVLSVSGCSFGLINGWLGTSSKTRVHINGGRWCDRKGVQAPSCLCVPPKWPQGPLSNSLYSPPYLLIVSAYPGRSLPKNAQPGNSKPQLSKCVSHEPDDVHKTNSTIFLFYPPPLYTTKGTFMSPRFHSRWPWEAATASTEEQFAAFSNDSGFKQTLPINL